MGSFKERSVYPATFSGDLIHDKIVVVNDSTRIDLGDIGAADTFTLTPTRVDTATAGAASGPVTFVGAGGQAAATQTAVRAMGGIYATATVTFVSAELYDIVVFGGYNVTWVVTPTGFTPGATVETTAGSVAYTKQFGIGKFAEVKRVHAKNFKDDALILAVTDADGKTVFSATVDTNNAGVDQSLARPLLTADGVAGEDGAAAANASSGVFRGPLTAVITAKAPYHTTAAQPVAKTPAPRLTFVVKPDAPQNSAGRVIQRTSGNRTAAQWAAVPTIDLGAPIGNIKRIKLENGGPGTPDTGVAPTLTDADGLVVYTKSSTDYTTPVLEQLSHEGVDQAGNTVADLLDVVAKSPLTFGHAASLTTGTFKVTVWVEV